MKVAPGKVFSWFVIVFSLAMALPSLLSAERNKQTRLVIPEGESRKGDRFFVGESARINGGIIGDLVFAGRTLRIDGTVTGDLMAGGQDLGILGEVQGDIWAAGQEIRVEGSARDDVRSVGQRLEIKGKVAGNVLWFGQELHLASKGEVGKNLRIGTQNAVLSGLLRGNLRGDAQELVLGGEILGDVDVRVQQLTIQDKAVIHGSLRYQSPSEAAIAGQARLLQGIKWVESKEPPLPG